MLARQAAEEKVLRMSEDVAVSKSNAENLGTQLKEASNTIFELQTARDVDAKKINELEQNLSLAQNDLVAAATERANLAKQIEKYKLECAQSQQTIADFQANCNELNEQLRALREQCVTLEKE